MPEPLGFPELVDRLVLLEPLEEPKLVFLLLFELLLPALLLLVLLLLLLPLELVIPVLVFELVFPLIRGGAAVATTARIRVSVTTLSFMIKRCIKRKYEQKGMRRIKILTSKRAQRLENSENKANLAHVRGRRTFALGYDFITDIVNGSWQCETLLVAVL